MSGLIPISETAFKILKRGGVFVPSPLALDDKNMPSESYQRLLTLYYIRSGAKAVIPGAHTGEFALHHIQVFSSWLKLVKEMTREYGKDMLLMAAIGGNESLRQAEIAAKIGFDIVMVAPTAFAGKDPNGVIELLKDIASVIPTFGFELQRAIPGSYSFTHELWNKIFDITYGAKGASFDTYRSINMLHAAACSARKEQLVMLTGNDDRIVTDLLGEFAFYDVRRQHSIRYRGGLLGHFATDTNAVVRWVNEIMQFRETGDWKFPMSSAELAHAVNHCNMELFDALGNFENSVWGVKYRLASMGLLPGPYCANEKGRKGMEAAIDKVYASYPLLTDTEFLKENLDWMRKEVGVI